MNILYILRHNPWGIGGGCYACRCYLDAFTTAFPDDHFDVSICKEYLPSESMNADYPNVTFIKVGERSKFSKLLSPFTGVLHRFYKTTRLLLIHGGYDYCIFDHNSIAGPLVGLCKKLGVRTIVINHNCEAEYYRDNYDWLHQMLFHRHVKRTERQSYLGCNYNIFLTEEDRELFGQLYGHSETQSIVTGCFEFKRNGNNNGNGDGNDNSGPNGNEKLKLVISGTIGNVQNMDGIQFFLKELLDCAPKTAEVVIAGKNPPEELTKQIDEMNKSGRYATVSLIANPANITEIVNGCDIFVCPTRLGGGLKLRVMDGLRAGLPVIAHKVSARGYSEFEKHGFLWAFDSKQEFAAALSEVIQLIRSKGLNRNDIQDFANKQFSFEGKVEMLKNTIV